MTSNEVSSPVAVISESNFSTGSAHHVAGEHVYRGVTYMRASPPDVLDSIKDFEFREDDTIVVAYPKSGTHWMRTIVGHIRDVELHRTGGAAQSRPAFLEMLTPPDFTKRAIDVISSHPSPRFFMSHIGVEFFKTPLEQKKGRFIIVMRNLKDTLVSYYHFYRSNIDLGRFEGTFEEWFRLVREKRLVYGDWFDHTLGWWQERHNPNVSVVYYEHMKQDLGREVRRVAEVLGVTLSTEEVDDICRKGSFDSMKVAFETPRPGFKGPVDNSISPFMRRGDVGDWRNHFSGDLSAEVDTMYQDRMQDVADPPTFLMTLE